MNVFLKTQFGLSRAMDRIVNKLVTYSPGHISIVDTIEAADLVILHVIGFPETEQSVKRLKALGKKYAIIQYCLRTTQNPNTADWVPIWADAELVWSYYDLHKLCEEDGVKFPEKPVFLYAPLGVDEGVFNSGFVPTKHHYKVLTTGTLAPFEAIDLVNQALEPGDVQCHIGHLEMKPETFNDQVVEYFEGISDIRLAQLYRQTEFVCGLRRVEGFELPAAEGLLCGAIPILFDKPHYREWYGDLGAVFIEEGSDEHIVEQLREVFRNGANFYRDKILLANAKERFNWQSICSVFWDHLPVHARSETQIEVVNRTKRRLVWVGDAVASTGFAKCTHKILETLHKNWEIHVLGLNYYGDPVHDYPYKIYPAQNGGDFFGVKRLPWLIERTRPEMVVIQNDPWNFPQYLEKTGSTPIVGIVAVDGLNCRGEALNGLHHAIFWTEFGRDEACRGGYRGPSTVIPLGVDLELYKPIDRTKARQVMGIYEYTKDSFVIGNVNRNQPRKRLDLTIKYFCEWVKEYRIDDAFLYLHVAPTGDQGYDPRQLMKYYSVPRRLILCEPELMYGISEDMMPYLYNCFDVQVSTTQGEGFGLTTLEGMACGIPQIVPEWSALADLFMGAADMVPCTTTIATPNNINVIGGVPDRDLFITNLNRMYKNHQYRLQKAASCLHVAKEERFSWNQIGQKYVDVLNNLFVQREKIG